MGNLKVTSDDAKTAKRESHWTDEEIHALAISESRRMPSRAVRQGGKCPVCGSIMMQGECPNCGENVRYW